MNPKDFEEFIFSSPTTGTPVYTWFLKSFIPSDDDTPEPKCVFTHSDFRPANIRVVEEAGRLVVSGIIDWEFSGFYPDYWECLKSPTQCRHGKTRTGINTFLSRCHRFIIHKDGFWTESGIGLLKPCDIENTF
jgi:hypothetical protein